MIRLIVAGVLSLVVGVAAGTALGVLTAPLPKVVAVKSKAADSLAVATHASGPAGTTAEAKPAAGVAAVPASSSPATVVTPAPAAAVPAAPAANAPIDPADVPIVKIESVAKEPLSYRQVARILSNMNPQDAVKILGYLGDAHVEGILNELGVRQAAGLLSQLPTERAARLSERLMHRSPVAR